MMLIYLVSYPIVSVLQYNMFNLIYDCRNEEPESFFKLY